MRKTAVIAVAACLCVFSLFCGARGGKYADVVTVMEGMVKAQENYISALEKVKSPADLAGAVNTFTDTLEKMVPRMLELQKKFPELKDEKNHPAELKTLETRMEENFSKLSDPGKSEVMKKIMAYFADAGVQKAFARMQKVMAPLDITGR